MAGFLPAQLQEKLEALDGSRVSGARGRAAVRFDDLASLLAIPARLQANPAAGAVVTPAEFNALVKDVQSIHQRLVALADALRDPSQLVESPRERRPR